MIAETTIDLPKIETRMLRWMTVLAAAGTVVIFATGRWQTGLAFVVGASLGVLNFHWLWQMSTALMDIQAARVPRKTVALLVARYPLAFGGLALLYITGWLPLVPVIAGMLIPGAGVLMESLFLLGAGLGHKQAA